METIHLGSNNVGDIVNINGKSYKVEGEKASESCGGCAFVDGGCFCVLGCDNRILKEIEPKMEVGTQEESFFKRAYSSLAKVQEIKNAKYGESALEPLDIFAKHHPYGSRLDEKLARVKNSDTIRKNDVCDLIGGLMLICKSNGWDNFEDQID